MPEQFLIEIDCKFKLISLLSMLLFLVFCFLVLPMQMFAQSSKVWKYVAQTDEGKYYVKQSVDKLPNRNRAQWGKIISPEGEEEISRTEWDCRQKRFRLMQVSTFAPDGTALSHQKNLDWAEVAPETVSEVLYEEACGTPMKISYAEIISPQAKMRIGANSNSQVLRVVKSGERFPLVPFKPAGAWYHVYDPETLFEYWLHGNSIKIVADEKGNSSNKNKDKKVSIKRSN